MRALHVVMSHVLADEFSQVRHAQRDDAVETLLFDRADEALDESVQVGATPWQANFSQQPMLLHAIPKRVP